MRGWFERGLFLVMGPAQIGDLDAPLTYTPSVEDLQCPRCHRPWDDHQVVRTTDTTIAHCPAA